MANKLKNMVILPGTNSSEADSLFGEDTFYIEDLDLEGMLTPIEGTVVLSNLPPNGIGLHHLHLGYSCRDKYEFWHA